FWLILNETLVTISFSFLFFGFHLTFFIRPFLGLMGMPCRYWVFLHDQGLDLGNVISSIGAFLMGVVVVVFLYNIVHTAVKGEKASADPWDGRTREWSVSSPP